MTVSKNAKIFAPVFLLIFGLGTAASAISDDSGKRDYLFAGPTGTWLLNVEFPSLPGAPPPPPPFTEILTFHALGTLSESNTLLNENSYNPRLGQGCGFSAGGMPELNCNGSDGTGIWRRTGRNTLSFVVVKLVYDGETNAHVGYLRVRSDNVRFRHNKLVQVASDSLTEFLVGTDIDTAIPIPFGGADSKGMRIR